MTNLTIYKSSLGLSAFVRYRNLTSPYWQIWLYWVCQIWALIHWGSVISHVMNNEFILYWSLQSIHLRFVTLLVTYGECPHKDKFHWFMTNPYPASGWWYKQAIFKPMRGDIFLNNQEDLFCHLKNCNGSPLLKYSIKVCHLDLSDMGTFHPPIG